MPIDPYQGINNPGYPPRRAFSVTPTDNTDLPSVARWLWVGGTGTLKVLFAGDQPGSEVTFTAVPAGILLPFQIRRVQATGTSATLIVALCD
jgi:hypothetical protein